MSVLPDTEAVVRAYRKIRAERSANTKAYEARDLQLKTMLERLEGAMLAHLNATKSKSINTEEGTFYKQEDIMPSAADWPTIYRWIGENDAFEMLEKRLTKKVVKQYMDDNDGAAPPGINVQREWVVRVRKGNDTDKAGE